MEPPSKERKAKLIISHEGKDLPFLLPAHIGSWGGLLRFTLPTLDQYISLLYGTYTKGERIRENGGITSVFDREITFMCAEFVYWTHKGIYIIKDSKHDHTCGTIKGKEDYFLGSFEKSLKGVKEVGGVRVSKNGLIKLIPKEIYPTKYEGHQHITKSDKLIEALLSLESVSKIREMSDCLEDWPLYKSYPSIKEGCTFRDIEILKYGKIRRRNSRGSEQYFDSNSNQEENIVSARLGLRVEGSRKSLLEIVGDICECNVEGWGVFKMYNDTFVDNKCV